MGQKVCPIGLRIGITQGWKSLWYADKKDFGSLLVEDQKIRKIIKKSYGFAGIPVIEIERTRQDAKVTLHTARPGLIIGRKGAEVDKLRDELQKFIGREVVIKIKEITKPELYAQLVAENIAEQLEKRAAFRRTMKKAMDASVDAGAKGVKMQVAGRLGGAEIARTEKMSFGSIPLHTLRADVDYGFAEAKTTYGVIGVKVWIYKGLIGSGKEKKYAPDAEEGEVQEVAKTEN
ncbi:MAG: 30S ribosomal protein S3 [Candidatus Brocadia sp. AMX2]|uniref:Small ribosomal subunit protein uS3 n=1 Tax=Candidatus Brocadia sinica JPN1 TaxID=1197129 RepID=A0ABQ0JY54_9BACT|nr:MULTISPECIES: 30S ribosomal protein S3 [Brocadia]KXK26358.1 MAG: 30S ribosomal protein S3 [Candidatus Brocadia sinica]MBC6932930.1 30S ribosomal protein S3 [Candidatus Brocadia sp.]MBL1167584.1 30S ribosomal protein S3 [Candidatus Brocadia sp. AMX1]NOG40526.1 30S ribosomal protein S3 [Planctomycetota bacterium]KAA0242047.1 MAG: 30S ribosomal protein S3 [Candidatus Brocadia sp. AMX2]